MKRINYLLIVITALVVTAGCNKVSYKKTKSGLLYKVVPAKGKDSLIKNGQIVKFHVFAKLEDSVLYTSYGKVPAYAKVQLSEKPPYNLMEILTMMRKGDSAVTVQLVDTLMKQGMQLPPNAKKGGRITTTFRILEVFAYDSIAMADYNTEMEKDRPRAMKEQQEQMAKEQKARDDQQQKDVEQWEKSGEAAKEIQDIEGYLAAKKINAQKTGKGTFVVIQQQGTGAAVVPGKYINVKYTGKILTTDSTFESGAYPFQLGKDGVITGWVEGLQLFKQGGKGTLYIPGFLAYGANPGPGGSPFEALKFDVEILEVSDQPIAQQPVQPSR